MGRLKKESKDALKLHHKEYILYLQIIWTSMIGFTISFIIGTFSGSIKFSPIMTLMLSYIIIASGILMTILVFRKRFDEIRSKI